MIIAKKDLIAAGCTAALVAASIFWAMPAGAQTTTTTSGASSSSSSSAQVESSANASASGGSSNAQIYLDQSGSSETTIKQRYSGSYTVRSAPAVQPPSMGSGHPCALATSVGISLIGGGAAGGVAHVDEACLLAQMGQGQAALIMIARRDREACYALRQVGSIPPGSTCTASERRASNRQATASSRQATVVSRPQQVAARAERPISSYVGCARDDKGRIVARKQSGTPYSNDQITAYCRTQVR